ncbi:hypothetical protein GCM10012275_02680 [Longimycelium tulufanense]|uniref:ROK family protein n=1 Tax=Longimycelium tulufanense TaxID=907463 RepID=A0A8J3FUG5_9PSEU|nr:hypothetical protein GCM10012275_02680 [Longimycelium tulufanense]
MARAGNERALQAVRTEAARLAYVVAAVTAVVDPELVVLGGGVGANADLLLEPMGEALQRLTPLAPRVVAGALGADAELTGALAVGLRTAEDIVFAHRLAAAQANVT